MRINQLILLAALFTPLAHSATDKFGEPVDMNLFMPISTLMAAPDDYIGQELTVEGTIVSVCSKRGCWMELATDDSFDRLKVKVRDGEMVFPVSARGLKAYATGEFKAIKLNIEETRAFLGHQAEQHNKPFDPESVTQGLTFYQLQPYGVEIRDAE
ncbi:DUF4920 domain-containing protein [Shewanella carassii]|uniref:DUF4920 domain-containing protein n=1 Tax=Shewanella carassii TaxID=1987584 RepID=A0ABQ1TB17_9GAMM|nr:DUF4920 domain-containing protein [Shewanella carassii]BCV67738.1 hypothetical protein TUM17387_30970 [Shewanella carassii]GGE87118.1 hypothetical protein GCM10011520_29480 [Shewanella carassii]